MIQESPINENETSVVETDVVKPRRGRPSKPNVKDENGKYLCKTKYYEENSSEITARNKETQNRYRECYRTLKELVLQHNIEIPEHMKEKVNKLICF